LIFFELPDVGWNDQCSVLELLNKCVMVNYA
jgi:hypothetical protein